MGRVECGCVGWMTSERSRAHEGGGEGAGGYQETTIGGCRFPQGTSGGRTMTREENNQERVYERTVDAIADGANAVAGGAGRVYEGIADLKEAAEEARAARGAGASLVEEAATAVGSLVNASRRGAAVAGDGDSEPAQAARSGLLHLYCGDGKGKTTAAMGLALRALGHGKLVTVVQFLKDGRSGELGPLQTLGAAVFSGASGSKFSWQMTDDEKAQVRLVQTANLKAALELASDLVVLDEACAAWRLELVDRDLLRQAVLERPAGCEMVLTGRDPADWMREASDYITEMRCEKHPFERGVPAREGVEY